MKPIDTINAVNTRPRTTGTPQSEVEQFIKEHGLTDLDKNPKAPARTDTTPESTDKHKKVSSKHKQILAQINRAKLGLVVSGKLEKTKTSTRIIERRKRIASELYSGAWIQTIRQSLSPSESVLQRQDMEVINQDLPLIKLQSINSGQHYFASIAVLSAVKKAQGSYGKASAIAHIEQGFMIYVDAWCVSKPVQSRALNELKLKYDDIYRVIDMKNNTIGYCRLKPRL